MKTEGLNRTMPKQVRQITTDSVWHAALCATIRKYRISAFDWVVVLGLTARRDSISIYIEPSPREEGISPQLFPLIG